MSDMEFLQQYIDSPETPAEEAGKGAVGEFFAQPLEKASGAVQVTPGEKVETVINEEKKKSSRSLLKSANIAKKKTDKVLGAAVPDLSDLPTPPSKGIGLLVFISLLVVFAITPIGGKSGTTRLSLLWGAILGNATLPGDGSQNSPMQPPPGFSPNVPYIPGPFDVIQGVL